MNYKALTGLCGLYCGDCVRYKSRASHLAKELLIEISEKHFVEYAKVKKAHTKAFEVRNRFLQCRALRAVKATPDKHLQRLIFTASNHLPSLQERHVYFGSPSL